MTFDRARVRQLSRDAWGLMDADAFNNIAVDQCIATIETAILGAARELLGEPASTIMQDEGSGYCIGESWIEAYENCRNCWADMSAARLARLGEE